MLRNPYYSDSENLLNLAQKWLSEQFDRAQFMCILFFPALNLTSAERSKQYGLVPKYERF